ncbi:LuxR C-terminal-related transcriptional regulator [Variovorax sp. J22R115]|uniref:LuxR C-terminal-related transcriptional regulator n=1 Tax=Variovorax sp. J22R115 TaxID=3053509 RepID=UPI002577EBEA|nr:LuxR C-terminal-related transcriptional regulator [Variovorax sp. J22R115]MDM0047787.1 LuxR C-terminal-related transcriptional regulator [Variovorax sp. J22R115]
MTSGLPAPPASRRSHGGRPHRDRGRRQDILRMIVGGESLTTTAERLAINVKTVSTCRRRILERMGLASNAPRVQYAIHHRLVD